MAVNEAVHCHLLENKESLIVLILLDFKVTDRACRDFSYGDAQKVIRMNGRRLLSPDKDDSDSDLPEGRLQALEWDKNV